MNEVYENRMRNELARFREEHPEEFINLVLECLANRVEPDSVTAFRRRDEDEIPECLIVFFRGYGVAKWAEAAVNDLRRQMEGQPPAEEERKDGDAA